MGSWKVIKNHVGGGYLFEVVKQIRDDEPMYGGNMRVAGCCENEKEAEFWAERLNEEDGMYKAAAKAMKKGGRQMRLFVIFMSVVIVTQEIRLWILAKETDRVQAVLSEVLKIQKKETVLLQRVYKDLLEREAQYD